MFSNGDTCKTFATPVLEKETFMINFLFSVAGNSQTIALLLLRNWILMIEDAYETIDSRHVRLPSPLTSESNTNLQLKCDLMHLVNVVSFFS